MQCVNGLHFMYVFVHPNRMNQTLTKMITCGLENTSEYIKNYKGACQSSNDKHYPYDLKSALLEFFNLVRAVSLYP